MFYVNCTSIFFQKRKKKEQFKAIGWNVNYPVWIRTEGRRERTLD